MAKLCVQRTLLQAADASSLLVAVLAEEEQHSQESIFENKANKLCRREEHPDINTVCAN